MVHMHDGNSRKRSRIPQRLQHMQQRERIRAAAYGNEELGLLITPRLVRATLVF